MKILPVVLVAFLFLTSASYSFANGITISPPYQEVAFDKNATQVQFSISITNNTSKTLDFSLKTEDFGALSDTGGVAFLGRSGSDFEKKYGLTTYLSLEKDYIEVVKGKTETINVTVNNQKSLSPGGHYGAILAKVLSSQNNANFSDNVTFNQTISSLVLVKKTGGEIYQMNLDSIGDITTFFAVASIIDLRFQNSGNVHLVPRGIISISDPFGKIIERGIVNEDTAYVLPESFRIIPVTLKSESMPILPGFYQLSIFYRYDGKSTFNEKKVQFFFIPFFWYLLPLIIIIGIIFVKKRKGNSTS